MAKWLDIALVTKIPENSRKVFLIEGVMILIFNIANEYYAIDNLCPHASLPLDTGTLEGNLLTCPFHGAKFCIKTGEVKTPPAFDNLITYEIRKNHNKLEIFL